MLVLKADGGVVVRGGVPQASAGDLDPLVLHLADRDLHHNLVTRDVHRRLALLFNLISDALAQCLMKSGSEKGEIVVVYRTVFA